MSSEQQPEVVATATPAPAETGGLIEFGAGGHAPAVVSDDPWRQITDPLRFTGLMGQAFVNSGMFGCKNAAQGHVLALACVLERRNPLELVRTYHIIGGKLSMRADAMQAEFERRGGVIDWTDLGTSGEKATAKFTYKNHKRLEISYTMRDAQIAGLVKPDSGWVKNPAAMLRARLISTAVRLLCPSIVAGTYTPEELSGGLPEEVVPDSVTVEAECVPVEPVQPQVVARPAAAAASAPTSPAPAAVMVAPLAAVVTPAVAPAAPAAAPAVSPAPVSDLDAIDSHEPSLAPPMCTDEQFREIGHYAKNVLQIPMDRYREILAKRLHWQTREPVARARDLTADQAESLLVKFREAEKKQQLNAWVSGQPVAATAQAPAPTSTPAPVAVGAGVGGGDGEIPF